MSPPSTINLSAPTTTQSTTPASEFQNQSFGRAIFCLNNAKKTTTMTQLGCVQHDVRSVIAGQDYCVYFIIARSLLLLLAATRFEFPHAGGFSFPAGEPEFLLP